MGDLPPDGGLRRAAGQGREVDGVGHPLPPAESGYFCDVRWEWGGASLQVLLPRSRSVEDGDGVKKGVVGSLELVNSKEISTQPIVSYDWHQNKQGLAVFAALDQTIRVIICTKLNLY